MAGSEKDVPVILNWFLRLIWKMTVLTDDFSNEASEAMEDAFTSLMQSAVACSVMNCSSNGGCTPNLKEWTSVGEVRQDYLFSFDACFCAEGWQGSRCENQSGDMAPITPPASNSPTNTEFKFKTGQIVGFFSLEMAGTDCGHCWLKVKEKDDLHNWRHNDLNTSGNDKKWKVQIVDETDEKSPKIRLESLSYPGYYLHTPRSQVSAIIAAIIEQHDATDITHATTWIVRWVDEATNLLKLGGIQKVRMKSGLILMAVRVIKSG